MENHVSKPLRIPGVLHLVLELQGVKAELRKDHAKDKEATDCPFLDYEVTRVSGNVKALD